jgi:hypothetical protein
MRILSASNFYMIIPADHVRIRVQQTYLMASIRLDQLDLRYIVSSSITTRCCNCPWRSKNQRASPSRLYRAPVLSLSRHAPFPVRLCILPQSPSRRPKDCSSSQPRPIGILGLLAYIKLRTIQIDTWLKWWVEVAFHPRSHAGGNNRHPQLRHRRRYSGGERCMPDTIASRSMKMSSSSIVFHERG